jgi:hypothetical protein
MRPRLPLRRLPARLLPDQLSHAPRDRPGATGLAASRTDPPPAIPDVRSAMTSGTDAVGDKLEATMSTEEHEQPIFALVDGVWTQHRAAAIDRYFGPGLREEATEHYQQLPRRFPTQVTVEDDLIAEGDMVVARVTLMGTCTGPFAGQPASGAANLPAGRRSGSTGSTAGQLGGRKQRSAGR